MNQRPHSRAPAPPQQQYDEDGVFIEERVNHAPPAVRPSQNGNSMETEPAPDAVHHDFPMTGFKQLAGAVASVMAEIKPVEKSGWNDFHKYNYARMQDLSTELTPLMGKHGIMVIQNELDRSMFDDGRVVAVRYEFTIVHKSGEIWPERPRYTGMSSCRNTKGGFDDKCFNKCHTSARKYFLIGLFQIPTEDEGADGDTSGNGQHARPQATRRAPSPEGKVSPHLLPIINQETPEAWGDRFLKLIEKAATSEEVDAWYNENYNIFQKLKEKHGGTYDNLVAAMDRRESAIRGADAPPGKSGAAPAKEDPISSGPPPKRQSPPKTAPADAEWLEELRNAFSACEDTTSLAEVQAQRMTPKKGKVPDLVWNEAIDIVRSELLRLEEGQVS